MKKALIIDDEPLARSIVAAYLESHNDIQIVEQCNNGFEALKAIEKHQPDLLFLDIQMPKISGFELLELLDQDISVIFTTAFDEYAIQAFEAAAIDYLLKPFTKERFDTAIHKWRKNELANNNLESINNLIQKPEDSNRIVIKNGGEIQIIPIADVYYLEAYDDYVKVHVAERYFLKKKTMNAYEKTLPKANFVRIHRSFLINVTKLTKIESFEKNNYQATLTNGAQIPISRNAYTHLKQILGL